MASIIKRKKNYSVVYNYVDENGETKQKWETWRTHKDALRRKAEIEKQQFTSIYAHILDEDRKVNAQKFETAFYSNPDLRGVRPPEEPKAAEPAPIDLASLVEQLQKSPELASTLAALIANQAAGTSEKP